MGARGRRSDAGTAARAPIDSPVGMTAASLRGEVIAARMARRWNLSTLQRQSGLSARTIRDIEAGADRRYSVTTLGALDRAFGWTEGHAWRLWETGDRSPDTPVNELLEQMAQLRVAVAHIGEELAEIRAEDRDDRPGWVDELVDLVRLLNVEDRRRVIELAERLAPR